MDDQVAQFVSITGASPQQAQTYLGQAGGDLEAAVQTFFAASEGDAQDEEDEEMEDAPAAAAAAAPSSAPRSGAATPSSTGGGNSLGGGPAEALPEGWGRGSSSAPRVGRVGQWGGSSGGSSNAGKRTGGIATLGSLASAGDSQAGHGDDDSDDEDDKGPENLYAGGERSGLNVQNPDRPPKAAGRGVVQDILKKAKEAGPPPGGESSAGPSSAPSWGSGNTLGSDSVASASVPDPTRPPPRTAEDDEDEDEDEDEEVAVRHLTFWQDGFSIEDGPLMRYEEPGNRELLEAINTGRAPPSLLNVRIGQPVEVRVAKRLNEAYTPPPPKPRGAWDGPGNRLGAPTPTLSPVPSSALPGSFPSAASSSGSGANTGAGAGNDVKFSVDLTQPTTSIQIRLGDGTRLVAKVNLTHTIGDVRGFINASRPASTARSYALQTTFPNKDLDDETLTVKDAKLENAVIVQRWT